MNESMQRLKVKITRKKNFLEVKRLQINLGKMKVMVSREDCDETERCGQWQYAACRRDVGPNLFWCSKSSGLVHLRCLGVTDFLTGVMYIKCDTTGSETDSILEAFTFRNIAFEKGLRVLLSMGYVKCQGEADSGSVLRCIVHGRSRAI